MWKMKSRTHGYWHIVELGFVGFLLGVIGLEWGFNVLDLCFVNFGCKLEREREREQFSMVYTW